MPSRTLILQSHSGSEVVVKIVRVEDDVELDLEGLSDEIEQDEMLAFMTGQKSQLGQFIADWEDHNEIHALAHLCPTVRDALRFAVECIERAWASFPEHDDKDPADREIDFCLKHARLFLGDTPSQDLIEYAQRDVEAYLSRYVDDTSKRDMLGVCDTILTVEARVGRHNRLDSPVTGGNSSMSSVLDVCMITIAKQQMKKGGIRLSVKNDKEYWRRTHRERTVQILRFVDIVHALQLGLPWPVQ